MNSHTDLKQNSLKSLMNYNASFFTDINENLLNGDVSSKICLLNSHTIYQDKNQLN